MVEGLAVRVGDGDTPARPGIGRRTGHLASDLGRERAVPGSLTLLGRQPEQGRQRNGQMDGADPVPHRAGHRGDGERHPDVGPIAVTADRVFGGTAGQHVTANPGPHGVGTRDGRRRHRGGLDAEQQGQEHVGGQLIKSPWISTRLDRSGDGVQAVIGCDCGTRGEVHAAEDGGAVVGVTAVDAPLRLRSLPSPLRSAPAGSSLRTARSTRARTCPGV